MRFVGSHVKYAIVRGQPDTSTGPRVYCESPVSLLSCNLCLCISFHRMFAAVRLRRPHFSFCRAGQVNEPTTLRMSSSWRSRKNRFGSLLQGCSPVYGSQPESPCVGNEMDKGGESVVAHQPSLAPDLSGSTLSCMGPGEGEPHGMGGREGKCVGPVCSAAALQMCSHTVCSEIMLTL